MKKISFSERYGLQQAVLEGRKTMIRRIVPNGVLRLAQLEVNMFGCDMAERIKDQSLYLWNEEVAIAQAYQTLRWPALPGIDWEAITDEVTHSKGWNNMMFVKAEYMPHRIRITDIKVERLQDISDEDCIKEGLLVGKTDPKMYGFKVGKHVNSYMSPREAYAVLIDRISGKGTWERNPWVFAYEFELIK